MGRTTKVNCHGDRCIFAVSNQTFKFNVCIYIGVLTSVESVQGVVASGMAFCIMTWCIRQKGPLFVTVFSPLLLIIVAIMSSIILDEKLHLGRFESYNYTVSKLLNVKISVYIRNCCALLHAVSWVRF